MPTLVCLSLCFTLIQTLIVLQPKAGCSWCGLHIRKSFPRRSTPRKHLVIEPTRRTSATSTPKVGFQDLPMELVIAILNEATVSQSSYRSLVLTSRRMRDIVRREFLKTLPIVLSREDQYESFLEFVQSNPQIGSSIQYLWMIPLDYCSISLPELILNFCPNIISLACHPQSLLSFLSSSSDPQLKSCKQLALQDFLPSSWSTHRPNFVQFCGQIQHLHLIGPFIDGWTVPTFPNLLSVIISHGQQSVDVSRFGGIFHDSANLKAIALVTELENNMRLRSLQAGVETWNEKESTPQVTLHSLPQDWSDIEIWLEGLYDKNFLGALHHKVNKLIILQSYILTLYQAPRKAPTPLQRFVSWWHGINEK